MKHVRFIISTVLILPPVVLLVVYSLSVLTEKCHITLPGPIDHAFFLIVISAYYFLPSAYGIILLCIISAFLCFTIIKKGRPRIQKYLLCAYIAVVVLFWCYEAWWNLTAQEFDSL